MLCCYIKGPLFKDLYVFSLGTLKLHFPKYWDPENLIMQNRTPKFYAVYHKPYVCCVLHVVAYTHSQTSYVTMTV